MGSTTEPRVSALIDRIISRILGEFGTDILACYVTGSWAAGTATDSSDLDLAIIAHERVVDEFAIERSARWARKSGDVVLDVGVRSLRRIGDPTSAWYDAGAARWIVSVLHASNLVYGNDVRSAIPDPPITVYRQGVITEAKKGIAMLRDSDLGNFDFREPVGYPGEADDFFGYTKKRKNDWYPVDVAQGTKELSATITWCASAVITVTAAYYVPSRPKAVELYAAHVGDRWTSFVRMAYETLRLRWSGQVPANAEEQLQLNQFCRETLEFENGCLAVFRQAGS